MDRRIAPILLLSIVLAVSAVASGQISPKDTLEILKTSELIPEDAIGEALNRQRAIELTAQAIHNAENRPLEIETLAALNQLIAEFGPDLVGMGIKLDAIEKRIAAAQQATAQKRSKYGVWSEAKGYVEFSPGNGGNPRIFNAIRFRPQGDPNTRFSFMLYLQNGLGTTSYDTLTVNSDEFYISTKFFWQNQPVNLLVGNFWISRSPFTIYRPFRAEDTTKEARRSFNGVIAQTNLWGLGWQGVVARLADGNGSAFDRYFLYNYLSTPITGGEAGLTLMKIVDDLKSTDKQQGAYDATTVGLILSQRGKLWGKGYDISGEANFCRLDPDVLGGPISTFEYAARVQGKWDLIIPLAFNYYAISYYYPTQNTAIQTIGDDFIYQYEENPWEPYYIANLKRWECKIDQLRLGNFAKATFSWNQAREFSGMQPKAFSYKGFNLNVDLNQLPLSLTRGNSLEFKAGEYTNEKQGEVDIKQKVSSVSLTRPLAGANLTIGYDVYHLFGRKYEETIDELSQIPFVEAQLSPLKGSTLKWRYRYRTDLIGDVSTQKDIHRLEWNSSIGPATWLRVRYDLTLLAQKTTNKNLLIEYRSGF